jgi:CRP-like cAMP-binding protein
MRKAMFPVTTANTFHRTGENRILATLSDEEYERLKPHMEIVLLEPKQILTESNEPIEHIYFPRSGVMSLMTVLENGTAIEMATIGNEGMTGIPVFLGANSTPTQTFSQVPGDAVKIPSDAFRREIDRGGTLHDMSQRYTMVVFNQIAQTAACNAAHPIEQRCARWLLMTHDRAAEDEYYLTQEFLAQMLGVRRATVNKVATALQDDGLIRYNRGTMAIVDRKGLEASACECYRLVRDTFDQLFVQDEKVRRPGQDSRSPEWSDRENSQ